MNSSLLAGLRSRAAVAGLNLFGLVDAERFDGSQPCEARCGRSMNGCGTVLVFGSGGPTLWRRVATRGGLPLQRGCMPLQGYVAAVMRDLRASLRAHGIDSQLATPADGPPVNLLQLAEAAGFGTVSPVIGVLLHPHYGPWLCATSALLVAGRPFGTIADAARADFQPCSGCAHPCLGACPVAVHDGRGSSDFARCLEYRQAGGCADGCDVRQRCRLGRSARYEVDQETQRQAEESLLLARRLGQRRNQRLFWW